MRILILLCTCFFTLSISYAQTFYVHNTPSALLLDSPSAQGNIIQQLSKGTPVEAEQVDKKVGFTLVRTAQGKEGWVQNQYLLAQSNTGFLNRLKQHLHNTYHHMTTLVSSQQELPSALQAKLQKLQQEVELTQSQQSIASMDRTSLQTAYNKVMQQNHDMLVAMQELMQNDQSQIAQAKRSTIITGALILIVGILLGLILPGRFSRRRQSKTSW